MDSESTNAINYCDCGYKYRDPRKESSNYTFLRSVKRKLDEFEENRDKFIIPRDDIENELREIISNQQRTIEELISDLEEERSASASSANEAMSMIMKLQREKAEIQMEARQFKRFSEEKTAHDQRELTALEELLYRRQLTEADGQSQPVVEKVIVGYSSESVGPVYDDYETSDRVYMIDSIHNVNNDQKSDNYSSNYESIYVNEIEDSEVKKLYARLHELEADRESMRQTLVSMRTDKAQVVLLKEIAQHLCKEISPSNEIYVKKRYNDVGLSFFSVFKWITSFGYLRKKAQRNKHIFSAVAKSPGALMLLDTGHQTGQWRCLSSTQV